MTASMQETFSANIFETLESEVRSYCRGWPAVFDHAPGRLAHATRTATSTSTSSPAPAP